MTEYCITHEYEDVTAEGVFHLHFINDGWKRDWSICCGPFTFSPPPAEQEDWELFVDVPSPDELEAINLVAEELLNDVWESFCNRQ